MLHIVLVHPEIPPNTGNVMRLARNCGARLHLVQPLGFHLDDRRMKRAGLDYLDQASLELHADWESYLQIFADARRFVFSTRSRTSYCHPDYRDEDHLVFGSETRGLPQAIRASVPAEQQLRLPMVEESRSLNLSNSVAIAVYEAWRQLGFPGATA